MNLHESVWESLSSSLLKVLLPSNEAVCLSLLVVPLVVSIIILSLMLLIVGFDADTALKVLLLFRCCSSRRVIDWSSVCPLFFNVEAGIDRICCGWSSRPKREVREAKGMRCGRGVWWEPGVGACLLVRWWCCCNGYHECRRGSLSGRKVPGEGASIADIHDCVRIRSRGRAPSARWYDCGGNRFLVLG